MSGKEDIRSIVRKSAEQESSRVSDEADEQTQEGEHLLRREQRKAKSPSLRAQDAEEAVRSELRERINVIQAKLNDREDELAISRPRVAELEQAEKTSKVESLYEGIVVTVSAASLGLANFIDDTWPPLFIVLRPYLIGAGIMAAAAGALAKTLFGFFGWPAKPLPKDQAQHASDTIDESS